MNNIQKAAKKFIKELNGVITFDTVSEYLNSKGYTVMYYSTPECIALLSKLKLSDYAKTVRAFTYMSDSMQIIFINDKLSSQDMLYTLIHECAHIIFGHLKVNQFAADNRRNELEAEAFTYEALHYKNNSKNIIAMLVIAFIGFGAGVIVTPQANNSLQPVTATNSIISTIAHNGINSESVTDIVYVTPSGERYHRPSCRYVKGKNCAELTKAQAEKNYTPCKNCNP